MRILSNFCVFMIALSTACVAQDSTRSDFEEWTELSKGRWVGKMVLVADWPGFGKKGDKVTAYEEAALIEGGKALLTKQMSGNATSTTITYFDAGTNEIRLVSVGSAGNVFAGVISKRSADRWSFKASGSITSGEKVEGDLTVTISNGGETQTWTGDLKIDGKPSDPLNDVWMRTGKN